MSAALDSEAGRQDVLPFLTDAASAGRVRLLIVGINPSPWTAAVNAPFARPGNRFWASLARAGVLPETIDASRGLSPEAERLLASRGLAITNLVSRPTARAAELHPEELRRGARTLVGRVGVVRPAAVAVLGITAFRTAFGQPAAVTGRQGPGGIPDWPAGTDLWVLPNPSGLNAHETLDSLAAAWGEVWAALSECPAQGAGGGAR